MPLVNTVHIAERRSSKNWHFKLDRWTFSDRLIQTCVSKAVAQFHSAKIAVKEEQLAVVHNGLSFSGSLSEKEYALLRQQWGVSECSKVLGSVGRLNSQKGYYELLNELDKISALVPAGEQWGLVLIGEGEERQKLEELLLQCPSNVKVVLPGFRKDAASCIGAFDCFLMPSIYEGFGLTLIEAMSHGVPVVCTDVDSLPELMASYGNGICVPFDKFVACIPDALKSGSVSAVFPFSGEKMTEEYLTIYRAVMSKARK